MNILKTERLILREVQPNDASFVFQLLNDPGWIQNIGDRNIRSIEAAKTYIEQNIIKAYVEKGYGMWLVVSLDGDKETPIGQCGLVKREWLDNIEIGFAFLQAYCGKGYGYESSKAVMDYAKNKLLIKELVAITAAENIASQKLLNKLGLTYEKTIKYEDDGEEVLYFTEDK